MYGIKQVLLKDLFTLTRPEACINCARAVQPKWSDIVVQSAAIMLLNGQIWFRGIKLRLYCLLRWKPGWLRHEAIPWGECESNVLISNRHSNATVVARMFGMVLCWHCQGTRSILRNSLKSCSLYKLWQFSCDSYLNRRLFRGSAHPTFKFSRFSSGFTTMAPIHDKSDTGLKKPHKVVSESYFLVYSC